MFIILAIILAFIVFVAIFVNLPKFGKLPSGEGLARIKNSPNYADGVFQNINLTPNLAEGASFFSVLKEFLFQKKERLTPVDKIPTVKTDLLNLDSSSDVLVWFGLGIRLILSR